MMLERAVSLPEAQLSWHATQSALAWHMLCQRTVKGENTCQQVLVGERQVPCLAKVGEVLLAGLPVPAEVDDRAALHDEGAVEEQEGVGRRAVDGRTDGDVVLDLHYT